jgi:RimJ/RimL family protein N-acetyltransferase
MPRLETERLILRGFEPADLDDFAASYADPAVMRYLGRGLPRTREETLSRLTAAQFRWQQYGLPLWAVVLKEGECWIGRCGFQPRDDAAPQVVELAFSYARWSWGNGYATEAARACIAYAFDQMGWESIIARARPGNLASLRVLQKLGFRREREIDDSDGPAVWCRLGRECFI